MNLSQTDTDFLKQMNAIVIDRSSMLPAAQKAYEDAISKIPELPIVVMKGSGNPRPSINRLPSGKQVFVIGEPNHRWSEQYLQQNFDALLVTQYSDLSKKYEPLSDPKVLAAVEEFTNKAGLKEKPSVWISHETDDTLGANATLVKKDGHYFYAIVVGADLLRNDTNRALSPLSSLGIGSPDNAIAVIAHEFGHVAVNTKLLSKGVSHYIRVAILNHNEPQHSWKNELDADAYSVKLCQGQSNLEFLKALKTKVNPVILGFLESDNPSHPALAVRIAALSGVLSQTTKDACLPPGITPPVADKTRQVPER